MKRTKTLKVVLALALAVVLCLGSMTSALAAPVTGGTEGTPLQAAITKVLEMPDGTTTPAASFTFDVTKVSVDGLTTAADLATMPALGTVATPGATTATQTINFTAADAGTSAAGLKTVSKETADIFAGAVWPHAGEYVYQITEQTGTYTTAAGETMTYSAGDYELHVYVANGTTSPYVSSLSVIVTTPGSTTGGVTPGTKVDPTPGTGGLSFTNVFSKNNSGTNPEDGAILVSKTVTGAMGNTTTLYFDFTLTVNKSAVEAGTPVYDVYVLDSANNVITSTNHTASTIMTDGSGHDYFQVTSGTAETIHLKHGEKLSVHNALVGSHYDISEAASTGYTPSVDVTTNGGTPVTTPGALNTALGVTANLVGENANKADYTNAYQTVTPTGISVNNLPFILMIAIAAGALVAFVAVKSRRKADSRN